MLSINPLTYLLSYLFETPTSAYVWVFATYLFFGTCNIKLLVPYQNLSFLFLPGIMCQIIDQILISFNINTPLSTICMYLPPFALISCFLIIGEQNIYRALCKKACKNYLNANPDAILSCAAESLCELVEECCDSAEHRYRLVGGIGRPIGLMLLMSVIFWLIITLIDYNIFESWFLALRELGRQ